MAYPNSLVAGYLAATGQLTPEMRMRTDDVIVRGYQSLLTFEVKGGGFNWWVGNDHALVWLTAYGIMEFADMERVTSIDRGVLDRAAAWLFRAQAGDGTWDQVGQTHGERISHMNDAKTALTAYVAWSLGESGFGGHAGTKRAVRFLESRLGSVNDAYVLGLIVNGLAANDSPRTQEAVKKLAGMARVEGETASWSGQSTLSHARGQGADTETTALAAYALLRAGSERGLADQAVTWLIRHRQHGGGWGSTQGTILAIKALIEQAKQSNRGAGSGRVSLVVNGRAVERAFEDVTPKNNDVTQQVDITDYLRGGQNEIELTREGDAALSYQVAGRYYLPWSPEDDKPAAKSPLRIDVRYDKDRLLVTEKLRTTVRIEYSAAQATFMVIADVGVPPGFTADGASLEKLVADGRIARYSATPRKVTLYIGELRPGTLELDFVLKPKYAVKVQTEPSVAYEYYSPEVRGESRPRAIEVVEK